MSIEKATAHLNKFGLQEQILTFDVSSATVELAAKALGCEGKRIAKTLSFLVGENCILIVAAGDAKIDNAKYKKHFGTKAKMLKFEEVEPMIGHQVGGVCPFGINEQVKVYLDQSLMRFESVYPACGSSNSAIQMDIATLEKTSGSCGWVDVCKDWQ